MFLATSSMHNRSLTTKPLSNSHFGHTTITVSTQQQPSNSLAQSGITRADLPYRSLAPLGVLSKYKSVFIYSLIYFNLFRIHTQASGLSNSNYFSGSLAPLQGLPGAAQLDMNISCLFMHEVRY
jgi:hypothetical protein